MAITRVGNTITVPQADSGIALPAGFYGKIIGVSLKAAAVVASCRVYSGTAIDAAKKIANIGDVAINSQEELVVKAHFKNGLYVDITGAGAEAIIYLA